MAGEVQPVRHQSDPADVGGVGADGGRMRRYGKTFELTDPRVMPKAQAAPVVTGWMRPLFGMLPFEQAVLLKRV